MTANVWNDRAEAYRQSEAHREGPDLDLIVEWAEGARTAVDVASGGGHVARRLRESGSTVNFESSAFTSPSGVTISGLISQSMASKRVNAS